MASPRAVNYPSEEGNQEIKDEVRKPSGMLFSWMRNTKCAEMYNAAITRIKNGELEEAILFLQEAQFFSPMDPAPLVAHAECFVFLCDIKSAIRQYRKALWVAQIRENIDPTDRHVPTLFSSVRKDRDGAENDISPTSSCAPAIHRVASPLLHSSATGASILSSNGGGSGPVAEVPLQPSSSERTLARKRPSQMTSLQSVSILDPPQSLPTTGNGMRWNENVHKKSGSLEDRQKVFFTAEIQEHESEMKSDESLAEGDRSRDNGSTDSANKRLSSTVGNSSFNSNSFKSQSVEPCNGPLNGAPHRKQAPGSMHTSDRESPRGFLGISGHTLPPQDMMSEKTDRNIESLSASNIYQTKNNFGLSSIRLADIQTRLAGLLDALGLIVFRLKDFPQALQCAEDSLALFEDPVVQLHRCVYLISLQREEEAESLLEEQMKKNEGCRVQTAGLLINLLVNRQAFRPARMLIDEFTTLSHCEKCIIVAKHIFYSKYERYRQKALEKKDVGTISKCIDVFPNDVELLFTRANIKIAAKQFKSSVQDLFRCVKETNGTHKEAIEKMTSVLFSIGTSLDGREGLRDAIGYYSESLKWQPENKLVLLARADCYVKLEDFESALTDYRHLLQIDPDDITTSRRIAFLHDLRGRDMYKQQKVEEAELEFSNAIKQCDTEPLFYYHRALCRFHIGESRYGLRDVLSCQQLDPKDPLIRAFIVRHLGTPNTPHTTKAFKNCVKNAIQGNQCKLRASRGYQGEKKSLFGRSITSDDLLRAGLCTPCPSRITETSQRSAKKYYNVPSARVAKVLQQARDYAEAEGWRTISEQKTLLQKKLKFSGKKRRSSRSELLPPELQSAFPSTTNVGLGMVLGSQIQVERHKKARSAGQKSRLLPTPPSKLPSETISEGQSNKGEAEKESESPRGASNVFLPTSQSMKSSLLLTSAALSSEVKKSSTDFRGDS